MEESILFMVPASIIVIAVGTIYFIPTIIASLKNANANEKIYTLNMVAGWTIIGWFVALIWAIRAPSKYQLRFRSLA